MNPLLISVLFVLLVPFLPANARTIRTPIRAQDISSDPSWTDPNTYTALYEFQTTNTTQTLDTSGNNYHLLGRSNWPTRVTVGTNTLGRIEYAYAYTSPGSGGYFGKSSTAITSLNSPVTAMTWFAWIYLTNASQAAGIIGERSIYPGNAGLNGLRLKSASPYNTIEAGATISSGSTKITATGATPITSNTWHFVSMRWKASHPVEVYLDNILDATSTTSNLTTVSASEGPSVGRSAIDYDLLDAYYFNGSIGTAGCFLNGASGYASTSTMATIMINTSPTNNLRKRP